MKKMIAVLIGCLAIVNVFAEDEWKPSATLQTGVYSKYSMFELGIWSLSDKPVLQSDLCFTLPAGFRAGMWDSYGLADKDMATKNEVDLYIGWAGSKDFGPGKIGADVSLYYFDEPSLFKYGAGDVISPAVEVNYQFKNGITPFLKWTNWTTMPESGFDGGNAFEAGCRYAFEFKRKDGKKFLSVPISSTFVWEDGFASYGSGLLWKGTVGCVWPITKDIELALPTIRVYSPITAPDGKVNTCIGVSLTWRLF